MSRFSELKAVGPCHAVTNSPITRGSKGTTRGRTAHTALPYGGTMLGIAALAVIVGCIYWLYRNRTEQYPTAPWVTEFAILHINEALNLYGTFDPMPEEVVGLLQPRMPGAVQQSLVVGLSNYLRAHCGRGVQRSDYEPATRCIRDLLSGEVRLANSSEGIRSYVKAAHKQDTGTDIPEAELAAGVRQILQEAKADEVIAAKVLGDILRFNMETMFKNTFGMTYWDYVQAKNPAGGQGSVTASA